VEAAVEHEAACSGRSATHGQGKSTGLDRNREMQKTENKKRDCASGAGGRRRQKRAGGARTTGRHLVLGPRDQRLVVPGEGRGSARKRPRGCASARAHGDAKVAGENLRRSVTLFRICSQKQQQHTTSDLMSMDREAMLGCLRKASQTAPKQNQDQRLQNAAAGQAAAAAASSHMCCAGPSSREL
jgi:hypothetical protein